MVYKFIDATYSTKEFSHSTQFSPASIYFTILFLNACSATFFKIFSLVLHLFPVFPLMSKNLVTHEDQIRNLREVFHDNANISCIPRHYQYPFYLKRSKGLSDFRMFCFYIHLLGFRKYLS